MDLIEKYNAAMDAFKKGKYNMASKRFASLRDFRDAADWAKVAEMYKIKQEYEQLSDEERTDEELERLRKELQSCQDLDEAKELYYKLSYEMGKLAENQNELSKAITYYEDAEGYSNSSDLLWSVKLERLNKLIEGNCSVLP